MNLVFNRKQRVLQDPPWLKSYSAIRLPVGFG
jgi:hypothetical protein